MTTLPALALALGTTIDPLRRFLRSRPELKSRGKWFGGAFLYDAEAAEAIKAAWAARVPNTPGRRPVQPAVA